MSENDDTIQAPQTLTFEPLGYLASTVPYESPPVQNYANELITNIIKDASKTASKNQDENLDNTNELNFSFPQTSKQNPSENTTTNLDKSEYSTGNDIHDENDFDEDIQKKMNGIINDFQSQSTNDINTQRKSTVSNHLNGDQVNNSTPIIIDPSTQTNSTESPIRSMSEPVLVDHQISNEQSSPLPIRQDESSSDIDDILGIKAGPTNTTVPFDDSIDQYGSEQENHKKNRFEDNDDFFNTKVASIEDDQTLTSAIKQNSLDETTRFGTTSPSRAQSASSKRSVHVTPDEPSTSGDEKRTGLSPSKLPDDTGNDTDLDNREVAIIARRPSRALSPLNRPRSPTPNDSRKMSANIELPSSLPVEQSETPTNTNQYDETNQSPILSDDNQKKQKNFELPTSIISPPSRRESTNKTDQQQTSQPTSPIKTKSDENIFESSSRRPSTSRTNQFQITDDLSKLITTGEQLQIPADDLDNERLNSPPPLSPNIKSLLLINPLLGSSLVEHKQDHSRPPSSEINRKSPTASMISNEKVIDGDILPSNSRRESNLSQQKINNTDKKSESRRESQIIEQPNQDELDNLKQVPSRRTSNIPQESTSHRENLSPELQTSSPRKSTTSEQKPSSRKGSTVSEQKVSDEQQTSSRRESITNEQKTTSRKGSTISEQQPPSKRPSTIVQEQPSSRRESTHDEQKIPSRKDSTSSEQQITQKSTSPVPEIQSSSRRTSTHDEQKIPSRKASTNAEQQQPPSKRESIADEQQLSSRYGSTNFEQKHHSRQASTASEQQTSSRKGSTAIEQQQVSSRRESPAPELQASSRRESHITDQQSGHHRHISFDQQEQKSSSKPVSRKTSVAEQQQASSSRRTSTNRDNQPPSPRCSSNIHISPSQESSRRNSLTKQEQTSIPVLVNKDSRRSSLNIHDTNHQQIKHETPSSDVDAVPQRTSAKHKKERTSSNDKRQKSSSTVDENNHRRSSFQRRSEQESKQNPNVMIDETVVTPIIMDSSKTRQQNGKRASGADSSYDQTPASKLPPVNSSFQQEKPRRSKTLTKQQSPVANRFESKHLSSSHPTTGSEDEQATHWTKKILIPSIHLSDDENSSSREDQERPQSPNVGQIAERNPVPSPPLITTSSVKKRSGGEKTDGQKRKEQNRQSRRSTSADSLTHIQLVDDKSLDSASENTADFDRHKRRHIKLKKKDVETNTDQLFGSEHLLRSFFDDNELTLQKPLKATKPMSDHLHSTRRRAQHKEQILTTPDTLPDTDTSTVRRTVKQTKDSHQDKDPVHVNVTVVVKKFASTTKDGTSITTAEATVEQKPQQYFETVQHPPEILPVPTENKDESIERPKSTEQQQQIPSTEQTLLENHDRHTQSDTEQIITDNQKKRRRPKRISRTCQTYECVFRRMERDQQQDLRTTSDTEKNIQTRKSQLRPRKKSPKRNLPVYLSTDSFKLEELLPKQFHQSRRNMSKSSSMTRSVSPQGGKLLILRPTLPFHHTDAVNVQRICLQYAIDLIPNESFSSGTMQTHRHKTNVFKQPEQTNNLPMLSASSSGVNIPINKSNTKEKLTSHKKDDYTHQRKNGGAV